ncbi:MAG: MFS transporter [Verrucomicrobia bacterium]|nr:MFS transporter [Verrucomicrobiota bacterium]
MPSRHPASSGTATPSRARHTLLWFVVSLAIVTYIDRVCISQTAGDIRRDLGLDEQEMGLVFGAFGLAYALFEIPGGWMARSPAA